LLVALATITDTQLFAVIFEMAPPPLPADVGDRDASVTVTTRDDHNEAIRGARVEVLTDIDDKVYRAGGGRTDASGVARSLARAGTRGSSPTPKATRGRRRRWS
jgi:hypothetical protein